MALSWEINESRQSSCLIGILSPPGGVSIHWAIAFNKLQKPPICDLMPVGGMPFGEARTMIASEMLTKGFQWLFFLDSDVLAPSETIIQLMSHRLPIVSALYYQRFPSWIGTEAVYRPVMMAEEFVEGKPVATQIVDFKPGSLVEAAYVGAGCLLIHRSVFEQMLKSGIKRFFEWTNTTDNPGGRSEDYEFCYRARQLGFKVIIDTSLVAVHETQAIVTGRGLQFRI